MQLLPTPKEKPLYLKLADAQRATAGLEKASGILADQWAAQAALMERIATAQQIVDNLLALAAQQPVEIAEMLPLDPVIPPVNAQVPAPSCAPAAVDPVDDAAIDALIATHGVAKFQKRLIRQYGPPQPGARSGLMVPVDLQWYIR